MAGSFHSGSALLHRSPHGGGLAVSPCRRGLALFSHALWVGLAALVSRSQSGCGLPHWVFGLARCASSLAYNVGRCSLLGPVSLRIGLVLSTVAAWHSPHMHCGGLAASVSRISVGQRSPLGVSAWELMRPRGRLRLAASLSRARSVARTGHVRTVSEGGANQHSHPSALGPATKGQDSASFTARWAWRACLRGAPQLHCKKGGGLCPCSSRSDECGWLPPHCDPPETYLPPLTASLARL